MFYMALYTVRRSSLGLVLWPRLQGGGFAGRWGCGSSWHYTQPLRLSCTMMFFMALQDSVISRKIHWEWRNTGNTQLHILHGPAGQCDFQENPLGMEEYWQLCNTPHHRLHWMGLWDGGLFPRESPVEYGLDYCYIVYPIEFVEGVSVPFILFSFYLYSLFRSLSQINPKRL